MPHSVHQASRFTLKKGKFTRSENGRKREIKLYPEKVQWPAGVECEKIRLPVLIAYGLKHSAV